MRNRETGEVIGGRWTAEKTDVSLASRSGSAKVTLRVNQPSVSSLDVQSASNKRIYEILDSSQIHETNCREYSHDILGLNTPNAAVSPRIQAYVAYHACYPAIVISKSGT